MQQEFLPGGVCSVLGETKKSEPNKWESIEFVTVKCAAKKRGSRGVWEAQKGKRGGWAESARVATSPLLRRRWCLRESLQGLGEYPTGSGGKIRGRQRSHEKDLKVEVHWTHEGNEGGQRGQGEHRSWGRRSGGNQNIGGHRGPLLEIWASLSKAVASWRFRTEE